MNTQDNVRPRSPERLKKSGPGATNSANQLKIPRLKPVFVTLKANVSPPTLAAFQFAQRSAATYLKFNAELGFLDRIGDRLAFQLVVHNYDANVSVTADYADGDDLQAYAQKAKDVYEALLFEEVAAASKILRADLSAYVTPLLDGFDALKRDLSDDPGKIIDGFRCQDDGRVTPWKCFHEQYGEPFWGKLGVLDYLKGGFETLRTHGILEPFDYAIRIYGGSYGDLPEAPWVLRDVGGSLSKLLAGIRGLPAWLPKPLSDSVLERASDVTMLVGTLQRQEQEKQKQETEELFQARTARLIELTGDEHLKFSLEQGFSSRATYYQLLLDTLAKRIEAKVIAPLVESGELPAEDHVQILFLDNHAGPAYTHGGCEESRSPSLASLKIYAEIREFIQSDEIAQGFGVKPEPMTAIIYDPDDNSDDWDDDDQVKSKNREIVVAADMFCGPLCPREDQLYIYVGKQPSVATSDETTGGSR